MMDMASDDTNARGRSTTPVSVIPPGTSMDPNIVAVQSTAKRKQSALAKMFKKASDLFGGNTKIEEEERPRRQSHYRRGTILIRHLEDKKSKGHATDKDLKFFEMIKDKFEAHSMATQDIISLHVFQTGENIVEDPFAVTHMPVEIQCGFRRKLFALFSIQLSIVIALICFFHYTESIQNGLDGGVDKWYTLPVEFLAMAFALMILYSVKYRFPTNFAVLGVYTVCQSVFFVSVDLRFDTKASLFIFCYLLFVMVMTTFISTIVMKRPTDDSPGKLISYPSAILISYLVAFGVSMGCYCGFMQEAVKGWYYAGALVAMFLLGMWFAYDASCMNERLSPDEYMQGMVFFYTDMVLFILFLCLIFIACFACEGDCVCFGSADIIPTGLGGGGGDDNDLDENMEGYDGDGDVGDAGAGREGGDGGGDGGAD